MRTGELMRTRIGVKSIRNGRVGRLRRYLELVVAGILGATVAYRFPSFPLRYFTREDVPRWVTRAMEKDPRQGQTLNLPPVRETTGRPVLLPRHDRPTCISFFW